MFMIYFFHLIQISWLRLFKIVLSDGMKNTECVWLANVLLIQYFWLDQAQAAEYYLQYSGGVQETGEPSFFWLSLSFEMWIYMIIIYWSVTALHEPLRKM